MFTIVKIKYQKSCLAREINVIFIVKPLNILYIQGCVDPLLALIYTHFKIKRLLVALQFVRPTLDQQQQK